MAEPEATREAPGELRGNVVILGLGSNQGDRQREIERALEYLGAEIALERVSAFYETEPIGVREQPWFLNLAAAGVTRLQPHALLDFVKGGELAQGRRPTRRFGPRRIDIDILVYDDLMIAEPELEIPHPRMHERAFVLVPLAEIAADWRHPLQGKTAEELLRALDGEVVRPYAAPPALSKTGAIWA